MTKDMTISYVILAIILNSVLNTPRRLPRVISGEVKTGKIMYNFLKPVDFYENCFCYCIGRGIYFFLIVALPLVIISVVFLNLHQISTSSFVFFICSSILGMIIEILIAIIISLKTTQFTYSRGLLAIYNFFLYFFQGGQYL